YARLLFLCAAFLLFVLSRSPTSSLFPYTTLFRSRVFLFNLAMLITPFYFVFKDLHYTLLEIVSRGKYFNIIAQTINCIRCTFLSDSKIFSSYYLSYIV